MRSHDPVVCDVVDLIAIIEWSVGRGRCLVLASYSSGIESDLLEDVSIG